MEITTWIAQQFAADVPCFDNEFSRPLQEYGITSLQLVNLVICIEDRFDIRFTPEEITGTGFSSVTSISELVEAKRHFK